MKLRNNKSVPFLGKNLPKRQRKGTKIQAEQPKIQELPKPMLDAVQSPKLNKTPSTTVSPLSMLSSPNAISPVHRNSNYELIPSSSESKSSEPDNEEIIEQSSYEEDSRVNKSLRRFSRGTPRSTRRNHLNSTMDKGTNTTNGKYGERDNPTEFSFSFSQVEHQSTIVESPVKDYTTTSLPPVELIPSDSDTGSDTEDEVYHAELNKYQHYTWCSNADPIPLYGRDKRHLTVFDFNSDDSNEISLIPETDSDDSDLPSRSFDPVALDAEADDSQAASDEQFDRIQGNMAKWTDAITTGFMDDNQNTF